MYFILSMLTSGMIYQLKHILSILTYGMLYQLKHVYRHTKIKLELNVLIFMPYNLLSLEIDLGYNILTFTALQNTFLFSCSHLIYQCNSFKQSFIFVNLNF